MAYASCQTIPAEQKYAPTELEVAGLIFAVEYFEVYLIGSTTTVYTDHQALVSSFLSYMKSQTRGLLARWYLRISCFLPNIKLEHKQSSVNCVADALSRAPVQTTDVLWVSHAHAGNTLMCQVQSQQRQDSELLRLIDCLENRTLPKDPQEIKKVVTWAN